MAIGNIENIDLFVATDVFPITPSDTTDMAKPARAIRANVAGTVRLITYAGVTRDAVFAAGETRMIWARRVLATGTTAAGLEAMV